tara:strand:+ start:141 stop:242 length:102 start_codon:yes stop_codon:yes gene_type:complete
MKGENKMSVISSGSAAAGSLSLSVRALVSEIEK